MVASFVGWHAVAGLWYYFGIASGWSGTNHHILRTAIFCMPCSNVFQLVLSKRRAEKRSAFRYLWVQHAGFIRLRGHLLAVWPSVGGVPAKRWRMALPLIRPTFGQGIPVLFILQA
jgi:hypothetical protein